MALPCGLHSVPSGPMSHRVGRSMYLHALRSGQLAALRRKTTRSAASRTLRHAPLIARRLQASRACAWLRVVSPCPLSESAGVGREQHCVVGLHVPRTRTEGNPLNTHPRRHRPESVVDQFASFHTSDRPGTGKSSCPPASPVLTCVYAARASQPTRR